MKRTLIALAVLTVLIAACATRAPTTIEVEVTRLVPVKVVETRQVVVTREIIVTATAAVTAGPTATPLPTTDLTKAAKGDGSYRTGPNISPGIWQSSGSGTCWIQINNLDGDLVDIQGNPPGSTLRIPAGDYIVVIGGGAGDRCTWSYLQP
jgi:hypothetical protein